MDILVTGGAGYVGSTLVDLLSQRGKHVRSLDNYTRGRYERVADLDAREEVDFLQGDIRDDAAVERAMQGVHHVIHLAAMPGLELCTNHPREAIATNVYGTWNLLTEAIAQDIETFIFASSAAAYGIPKHFPIEEDTVLQPINLYGVTKATGEHLLTMMHKNEGLPTVILRFANIYGMGWYSHWGTVVPKFVRLGVHEDPLTVYGSGKQTRDFIHVQDVARGIIHCLEADETQVSGEAFNLGSGMATSINQLAEIVQKKLAAITGKHTEIIHTEKREGEPYITNFRFSIEKIKERLGFKPRVKLEEGIEELIRHHVKKNE